MSVLVTGGAGYIGSHMVWELLGRGEDVVVLDNLSTGIRAIVSDQAQFVEGDAGDSKLVRHLLAEHKVDSIIHFAGSIVVPESIEQPLMYYRNNTAVARDLLEAAVESGVKQFVFSSTAAVYSPTLSKPIVEGSLTDPLSPYGRSKLMTEWMLEDFAKAYGLRYVALRYFNVAGADPLGRTGQSSPRATHLIKRACRAALGRVPHLNIFGTDYPTEDGTGVRDYIHVSDLVEAHALALAYLRSGGAYTVMNCGYGHGASVRQVIGAVQRVTGRTLPVVESPRRAGDSASLVAEVSKIKSTLNWHPRYDDLDEIVRTAYLWEQRLDSL